MILPWLPPHYILNISSHKNLIHPRVVEAADGREAVEAARKSCPALILMGVQMPVLDGLSAARLIRSIKDLCKVVIVAFSAFGNGGNREMALDAGCDDYVSKAEGVTRLPDILKRHLPHG